MNRLLKPLAVALALVMVMVILPVSVKADAGQLTFANSPVTFNETTIDGTNYIVVDLNGNLMYNNQPLANSNVVIKSVTITGINANDEHFAGQQTVSPTKVYLIVNPNCHNKTRSLTAVIKYTVNGVDAPAASLDFGAKITSGISEDYSNGNVPSGTDTDKSKLQSVYDITLRPTPIAKDGSDHKVDLQLHLAYQGDKNFQNAPLSYFRIEPVVSGKTEEFPFELEYSSYGKTMADVIVKRNADGDVTDTYFDFPFKVKSDAVNGYYPISFKLYHLYQNTNLQETPPVETTITTYVEISHGKKASSSNGSTDPSIDPSTAILLLDGYELNPQDVTAGQEFDLTLKIRNTSDKAVSDVKSTLTEANSTITPVNSTSSFFIDKIAAGETVNYTMHLKAESTAGILPVSLTLANAFVQEKTAKTSSDTFTIPVKQVANLSLDAPNYSVDTMAGDSFNLTMNLYNKGKSILYNVSVRLESDSLKADENYYAGNMDSGSNKSYDVMVTPVDGFSGMAEGDIVVSYEDADGNVTEKRTPISVNVVSYDYGNDDMDGMTEDDMPTDAMPESTGFPSWAWFVIGGVVIAAGAIVAVVVVRKRKKAKVDDDEMD